MISQQIHKTTKDSIQNTEANMHVSIFLWKEDAIQFIIASLFLIFDVVHLVARMTLWSCSPRTIFTASVSFSVLDVFEEVWHGLDDAKQN